MGNEFEEGYHAAMSRLGYNPAMSDEWQLGYRFAVLYQWNPRELREFRRLHGVWRL